MKKLHMIWIRIKHMDWGRFSLMIDLVHKDSHKPKIWIFFSMIHCALKYNVGYLDYYVFGFADRTKAERETYVTFPISFKIANKLNDKTEADKFEDKGAFDAIYKDFMGRDWLDLRHCSYDDFAAFLKRHDLIFVKPTNEVSGHGIEKLPISKDQDAKKLYDYLMANQKYIVEQQIIQHPEVNRMNAASVDSIRVVTILKDGKVNVMYALFRCSNGTRFIDNGGNGGIYAPIGLDDGVIFAPGFREDSGPYDAHPFSKVPFVGFKVPYFKELIEMAKKCALISPKVRYVGWDMGVTPNGPIVIEGNPVPAYDLGQNHFHLPTRNGRLPQFKAVLKDEL